MTILIDWEAIAHTDYFLPIPNRRALDRHLLMLAGTEISIAMIDFDHFKQINDQFGHSAGDEALRRVAASLVKTVESMGDELALACRFGGDEFVMISRLPAEQLGALCLDAVHEAGFKASVGVAWGLAGKALFEAADQAVYQAKVAGRDRVIVAGVGLAATGVRQR